MIKPMVLGNSLFHVKKYIVSNYGQDFFDSLIKDFDPEIKNIFKNAILSGKFYDVKAKVDIITAFRNNIKSVEEAAKLTTYECDSQINWLYGVLLRAISFNTAMGLLQGGWSKHFNTGTEKGETNDNGKNIKISISTGYKITPAYVTHIEYYDKRIFEIIGNCKFMSSSKMINDTDMELYYQKI